MDHDNTLQVFEPIFESIEKQSERFDERPMLAHYGSLASIESILKSNEIWFSNPLVMSDIEEIRFGLSNGLHIIKNSEPVRQSLHKHNLFEYFISCLDHYSQHYDENFLFDLYIFCLSEHEPNDIDGRLSMWRGYGDDGKGAALVFATSNLEAIEDSPLYFAPVQYGSNSDRYDWLNEIAINVAKVLSINEFTQDDIHLAAHTVFERLKLFAISTKHHGFSDEREWRVVYRVEYDTHELLKPYLKYWNGPRGLEPKLKLPLKPIDGVTSSDFSLDKILHQILLGPSSSTQMIVKTTRRMLEVIGRENLVDRVAGSSIPFRPQR